ncbi:hypothetical protein BD311DRAFT_778408 [Dichomitus squalens]|uniref:Uncharacterized protein n=1 Tax=Dichomitus squalens TaxID=114155 RepID=A0A4Q9ML78_9APHY|nr:hypothetical protein BD311DRAFT_778408 [Dichomitus squalens]
MIAREAQNRNFASHPYVTVAGSSALTSPAPVRKLVENRRSSSAAHSLYRPILAILFSYKLAFLFRTLFTAAASAAALVVYARFSNPSSPSNLPDRRS